MMFTRIVVLMTCVAISLAALGCGGSGGGGSDEEGKAKIDEAARILQEKQKKAGRK